MQYENCWRKFRFISTLNKSIWYIIFLLKQLETREIVFSRAAVGQSRAQPRTQALLPTPGAAAKTLASFGHVSPRIWEITKENIQGRAVGNIC